MKSRHLPLIVILPFAGCTGPADPQPLERPLVNLQITELDDYEALDEFVAELDKRNIKSSIMVDEQIALESCDQLRAYDQSGHEIMVYGRAKLPTGESIDLDALSLDEQRVVISLAKDAIEECLGHPVAGFRSYHFAHNEDTWTVLDEVGIEYNLSYVAKSSNAVPGHEQDEWPYAVPGHNFWAVPIHSAEVNGSTRAFCDMPFRSVSAEEWEMLLKRELDSTADAELPLKVLFHSYYSANDAGRWDAFVSFLDYAVTEEAEFVTVKQLMERMPGE